MPARPRAKAPRETPEVADAVARMIRAVGKRAGGDVDALPLLVMLRDVADQALCDAAAECQASGMWSWAEVADRLGMTRQSAHQRFARREAS